MSTPGNDRFATTRWSLIRAAADRGQPESAEALAEMCRVYWYPVFCFVRGRVPGAEDAQDLTQEFFCRLLEKRTVERADADRGRFRAFLLTSVRNFLANERNKQRAEKRGGLLKLLPLDFESAESRWSLEPADHRTPESQFEREWALALLDQVIARLRAEAQAAGKEAQFETLQRFLVGAPADSTLAEAGVTLGLTPDAARQATHRLRQRYKTLLREEIAQTLSDPADVDDELKRLLTSLSSPFGSTR